MACVVPIYDTFMLSDNISKFIYAHEAYRPAATHNIYVYFLEPDPMKASLFAILSQIDENVPQTNETDENVGKHQAIVAHANDFELSFYFSSPSQTHSALNRRMLHFSVFIFLSVAFTTILFALAYVPYHGRYVNAVRVIRVYLVVLFFFPYHRFMLVTYQQSNKNDWVLWNGISIA